MAMVAAAAAAAGTPSGLSQGAPTAMPGAAVTATSGPPIIALNGDNPAAIEVGATHADLGAMITGPLQDLNLGITTLLDGVTTTQITLDTIKPGEHTILYTVTDPKGLTGTATRIVIVSVPKAANDNQASNLVATSTAPAPTSTAATSTPPIAPAANDNQAPTKSATTTAASSSAQ